MRSILSWNREWEILRNLSETGIAANETSAVLQERANVTTAELDNSGSTPGANDTSTVQQSEPHLEIPKEENTTSIAMEGEGLTNTTISGEKGW